MVGENREATGEGFAVTQVLGLKIRSVGRKDEPRLRSGGRGTLLQGRKRRRDLSRIARDDVNVVGLKNAAKIGLVRCTGAQPFYRRLLVAEGFSE